MVSRRPSIFLLFRGRRISRSLSSATSLRLGTSTAEFKAKEQIEYIGGVSNVIPLVLGVYKPGLGSRAAAIRPAN